MLKRLIAVGLAVCLLTSVEKVRAEDIGLSAQLRKISLNLKGTLPNREEYQALDALSSTEREAFFREKTREYLDSDLFIEKMTNRIFEDLRFDVPFETVFFESGQGSPQNGNFGNSVINQVSQALDFRGLLKYHLTNGGSWDQILASSDFILNDFIISGINEVFFSRDQVLQSQKIIADFYGISEDEALQVVLAAKPRPENPQLVSVMTKLNKIIEELSKFSPAQTIVAKKIVQNSPKAASVLMVRLVNQLKGQGKIDDKTELYYNLALSDINGQLNQREPGQIFRFQNPLFNRNVELVRLLWSSNTDNANEVAVQLIDKARELIGEQVPEESSLISKISNLFFSNQFQQRYNQTRYSRSAALLRIFMCDEMKPIALGVNTVGQDAFAGLNRSFLNGDIADNQLMTSSNQQSEETRHVQKPCVACHRKLDPAQDLLDDRVNETTFVYDDENGVEHKIAISSQDELIPKLQQQDQYITCQSRKFWKWVVGEDVPLSGDKLSALKTKYRQVNGNVRELVTFLIQQPEFSDDYYVLQPTNVGSVNYILNRCNSCHSMEPLMPSFTRLPINNFAVTPEQKHREHVEWLHKIAKQTKFPHLGRGAAMPPPKANWILSDQDHVRLGKWIWDLARDAEGNQTITVKERDSILVGADPKFVDRINNDSAAPSFHYTWKRYFENMDFLKIMSQIFPDYNYCRENLFSGQKSTLGFRNPLSGIPSSDKPTIAFQSWLNSCLIRTIRDDVMTLSTANNLSTEQLQRKNNLYGIEFVISTFDKEKSKPIKDNLWILFRYKWSDLTIAQKEIWVMQVAESLIGPHVVAGNELSKIAINEVKTLDAYYVNQGSQETLAEALVNVVFLVINRDEFLTF